MKKLKKFVLHDAVRLSREEMASIEGMEFSIPDYCSHENDVCVYAQSYDASGHIVLTLGICHQHRENVNGQVVTTWSCDQEFVSMSWLSRHRYFT